MDIFTYSEARQNFSFVLDLASKKGEVLVKRKDGRMFTVRPQSKVLSPLDVPGIKTSITTSQIIASVRESRER